MKNFNNRYFTDIFDIFIKSNYRYIRVYRYFDYLNFKFKKRKRWKEKMVEQGNQITFPLTLHHLCFLLYTFKKIRVRVRKKKSKVLFFLTKTLNIFKT